ncbi:MAG: 50S ribosomal protein L29 [Phycisphaerales bacterium]|nr:50S ribosomal protein L29 [Phycisphaerales bacterium]
MKAKAIHSMNAEDLAIEVTGLRRRLFDLRRQSVSEKVADNSQFKKTRKDIARVLTETTARATAAAKETSK